MLKIKFNINEFTIIFLRSIEGKNECKRISFSLYQLQRLLSVQRLFFFFFGQHASFSSSLFFSGQCAPFFPFFFPAPHFCFLQTCCPFSAQVLSPKRFSVKPNTFLFFLFCSVFSAPFCYFSSAPPFVAFVQRPFLLYLAPHFFFSVDVLLF